MLASRGGAASRLRRRSRRKSLPYSLAVWALVVLVYLGMYATGLWERDSHSSADRSSGRSLLSAEGECPDESEYTDFDRNGGLVVYLAGLLYMFLGLAIVCDDYFVAALEAIVESLSMSEDVAGATFMAAGSSAPELFTSLISTLWSENSLGVGAIVGSAIFNVLVIIGVTATMAGKPLDLDWRPLCRDSTVYAVSVVLLILFFSDGEVTMVESIIFLVAYALYIVLMRFNKNLMRMCAPEETVQKPPASGAKEDGEALPPAPGSNMNPMFLQMYRASLSQLTTATGGTPSGSLRMQRTGSTASRGSNNSKSGLATNPAGEPASDFPESHVPPPEPAKPEEEEEEATKTWQGKVMWAITAPYFYAFKTIPDCRKEGKKHLFPWTFLVSILWIMLLSFFMVEWAEISGCLIGIEPQIMGLTILAAGTSVPDALSSVIVAKEGFGDMAVSNAIGSNVFDILLGLGFPWFLYTAIYGTSLEASTDGIVVSTIILFVVLFLLIAIIMLSKWRLSPKVGYLLFLLYAFYVAFTLLVAKVPSLAFINKL